MCKFINLASCLMFLFLTVGLIPSMAQESKTFYQAGTSFITNYTSEKNGFERQTWSISTCSEGLTYFANGGLLVGGNRFWETYKEDQFDACRSVYAISPDTILIGSSNELGLFIHEGEPKKFRYHSIMNKLDSSYHQFGNVWKILKNRNDILIRCGSAILSYERDTIVPLLNGDLYDFMTTINDTLYVSVDSKGLGYLSGNKLTLLPFTTAFVNTNVEGLFRVGNELMIFTDDQGIFITKGDAVYPFSKVEHKGYKDDQISEVVALSNGAFAVGTVRNGLFLMDREGKTIQHINKVSGLQNNTIITMSLDNQENLWLGLDNGISYIELNSCLTKLNSEEDVGTGYVSAVYNGKLYLGTNQGLFYTEWQNEEENDPSRLDIKPVKGTSGQVWSFFKGDKHLYCGHHKGLYVVDGNEATLVDQKRGSWQMDSLRGTPGYFVESTYRGFFILKENEKGLLKNIGKLKGLPFKTRTFLQDQKGYFWVVSSENMIYRFRINPVDLTSYDLTSLSEMSGLQRNEPVMLVGNPNQIFFSTNDGLYQYNAVQKRFIPNEYYNQIIGSDQICYEFFEDNYNRIWYVNDDEIGYFSLHFGQPEMVKLPFTRLFDRYTRVFGKIGVLDAGNILFAVDEGFYHYPYSCKESLQNNFNTFITDLEVNKQPVAWENSKSDPSIQLPVYQNKRNGFSFMFTSNIYSEPDKVMYRYKLNGLDEDWSDWTSRNIKEYNNLYEGTYVFEVVSKNKYNEESSTASFSFLVKPPPYRSPWAIFIYILLILGLIILLRVMRNRNLDKERQIMEKRKQEELDEKQKHYDAEQLNARQHIIALEKEKLEQDLLFKTKELSNAAYNILQKNEMLQRLSSEMKDLYNEKDLKKRNKIIQRLIRLIGKEINTKKDWEVFDLHFNVVHEDFIEKIRREYPDLNQNDQRLCIFLKMNKSTKEIATLMNMSVRGVETSRYRIRKKMNLDRTDNLFEVISRI